MDHPVVRHILSAPAKSRRWVLVAQPALVDAARREITVGFLNTGAKEITAFTYVFDVANDSRVRVLMGKPLTCSMFQPSLPSSGQAFPPVLQAGRGDLSRATVFAHATAALFDDCTAIGSLDFVIAGRAEDHGRLWMCSTRSSRYRGIP